MTDILDFLPIVRETADSIRARIDADANAGIDPTDQRFIDTTPGGFWWDLTQPVVLECERLYDLLSTEVPAAMFPAFAWSDYLDEHGVTLNLGRKPAVKATGMVEFTVGADGATVATGTRVAAVLADPNADPIEYVTTNWATIPADSSAELPVEASDTGPEYNVASDTVTVLLSPVPGVTAVTNPDVIGGGADPESDESYRERILLEFAASEGAGTQSDYERWALAYPGVGFATVQPLWAGAGTVRVIVTDDSNDPVSGTVITGLQQILDPTPGAGEGLAPIGAVVTVATPAAVNVTIAATVTHVDGYSLDGAGGTVATRASIHAALSDYVDTLGPGDDVVFHHVEARFFSVEGVYDVASVTINGSAATLAIAALEVATLNTVTLT